MSSERFSEWTAAPGPKKGQHNKTRALISSRAQIFYKDQFLPPLTLYNYIMRVAEFGGFIREHILYALVLAQRILGKIPTEEKGCICIFRVLGGCFIATQKMLLDKKHSLNLEHFCEVILVPKDEFFLLERSLVILLDWRLHVALTELKVMRESIREGKTRLPSWVLKHLAD